MSARRNIRRTAACRKAPNEFPFVVSLSNHDWRAISSFDKLRTNGTLGFLQSASGCRSGWAAAMGASARAFSVASDSRGQREQSTLKRSAE